MKNNPLLALLGNILIDQFGSLLSPPEPESQRPEIPEIAQIPPIQRILSRDGAVVSIIGRPFIGKSVCARRMAEIYSRPTYAVSPQEAPPKWITRVKLEDVGDIPPYSTLILDDLHGYMSNRDYENIYVKAIESLSQTARHERKLMVIFSMQVSSLADKYALTGDLVILKPPSILYEDLERPSIKKLQDRAFPYWHGKSERWLQKHAYCISHEFEGLVWIQMPSVGAPTEGEVVDK